MFLLPLIAGLLLAIFVGGCTQSPSIPPLRNGSDTPIERILLDDNLTARDIQQIFNALNKKGRLDALKPWILEPTPEQLDEAAESLNAIVYRPALDKSSVTGLIEERSKSRNFSDWEKRLGQFSKKSHSKSTFAILNEVAALKSFPLIAKRDASIAANRSYDLFRAMEDRTRDEYETHPLLSEQAPPRAEIMGFELISILTKSDARKRLSAVAPEIERSRFIEALLAALATAREEHGPAFAHGFASRLKELGFPEAKGPNQIAMMFELTKALEAPSEGFFDALATGIRDDRGYFSAHTEVFDSYFMNALVGSVWSKLRLKKDRNFWMGLRAPTIAAHPTPQFKELYRTIRVSLEQVLAVAVQRPTFLVDNTALYFNALALTRWFEEAATTWVGRYPRPFLPKTFFDQEIDFPASVKIDFTEVVDGKLAWTLRTQKEFALLPPTFVRETDTLLEKTEGFGDFKYVFESESSKKTTREKLREILMTCQRKREFGDGGLFFRALVENITGDAPTLFQLRDLEGKESLFDMLHRRVVQPSSLTFFRKLKAFLFDDVGLGNLDEVLTTQVQTWLKADPTYVARFESFHKNVAIIDLLDTPSDPELPTPFALYHGLLQKLSPDDMPTLRNAIRFVDEAKLFQPGDTQPFAFQTMSYLINDSKDLARGMYQFSVLNLDEQRWLAELLDQAFWRTEDNATGAELHWKALLDTLEKSPLQTSQVIIAWLRGELSLKDILEGLTPKERTWLVGFLKSEDFPKLWEFFSRHGSREKMRNLVQTLLKLEKSGELRESLELLSYIRDERMKHLAQVARHWEKSGELASFLRSILIVLN